MGHRNLTDPVYLCCRRGWCRALFSSRGERGCLSRHRPILTSNGCARAARIRA